MPSSAARRQVWIVDDSPTDAARARAALEAAYEVRTFRDGSAALEALEGAAGPDVLVLDWVMPGISGIEVCRFLRSTRPNDPIKILLLTAHGSTEQVVEGLQAGADDYVSKPWIDAELLARIGNLVRMRVLRERMEAAENRSRAIVEAAPDALFEIDEAGKVAFANEEASRVFLKAPDELIGQKLQELVPALELGGGEGISIARTLVVPDVRVREQLYSPSLRWLVEKTRRRRIISLRDVTDQRKAEARRLDFYSIIAHDLRSPLMAMQLRTDAILRGRRGLLPAELLGDMHKVQANIRSLVAMINDFLDLARLETSGYSLTREAMDLAELVGVTAEDFRPLAEASQLDLRCETGESIWVEGDRSRLKQVVSNLVGNALKFTPPGGSVVVRVERAGGLARCSVVDTGRGIPSESLPTIFERYARAIDSQHEVTGTGLGLMIVREILQAHGGNVGARSEVGKGSTFWFELPLSAATGDQVSSSM
ncbi:ATP-binding protein [Vulgatibacter sp.]|uniref:ATP-binding response regulator n=1 Tax=Vulgatibacter sp. TaxID=1971226 RepID=UPI00356B271C